MGSSDGMKHLSQLLLMKQDNKDPQQGEAARISPMYMYMSRDVYPPMEEPSARWCGVGIQTCKSHDGRVIVVHVHEGSPAEVEGVREGDEILYIENKGAQGMTQKQVVEALSGPPGTSVFVAIRQNQVKLFRTLERRDSIWSSEAALNDIVSAIERFKELDAQEQRRIEVQRHLHDLNTSLPSYVKIVERPTWAHEASMYLGPSQGKSQPPRVDLAVGPAPSATNTAGEAVLEKQGPELCGVGLQLKKWKDGKIVVEQVRESGPAERVGIRPGDFLDQECPSVIPFLLFSSSSM
ncbi:hypothetical protein GUITHDRAFT_137725 [Guillardia theta CCMP2712]|uniref:PDZ domain-containing protein n=1 Tax=Guillardia theta (strain CCMP2712) TaxID=905079 RepID=L1JFL2_GUITC|nr:hypothetical protein GUITHDRAFT_137725 [Guillardia theta CCMP2712]EKX47117.1 hypothetical protein GUITHDRAFT_137725 [Guillardia theta CCMP2712]|eukprot:XP_005834097.1 hypothetical protein GUITHDRAFT_137725 [Guillardia theta CCMP2712]